ncbi:MAG: glycosyltransferase family 39 protein [Elusimicrobia bacterium]|nr:glycosyltransferase family 39 protein [Elusimicrobiota bacterium]
MNGILKNNILPVCIMLASLALGLWGINYDLPHIYTTEEYKVVNYALRFGTGDLNPHFFNYPSLYLYFTFFVCGIYFIIGRIAGAFSSTQEFAISFVKDPSGVYLTLRIFSVLWTTGAALLVYKTGKLLFNKKAGLCAAALFTCIPSVLISAHEIRPSQPSLFFLVLSFYFLALFYMEGKNKNFYLSCISLGISISIFYNAIPMVVMLPVVYFVRNKKIAALSDARLWLGLSIVLITSIAGTPYSVLDFATFRRDFFAHASTPPASILINIREVFSNILFMGNRGHVMPPQGPPFAGMLCLAGTIWLLSKGFLLMVPVALFSIPVVFYHSPGIGYLFPAFPFLALAGGWLADKLAGKIKSSSLSTPAFILAFLIVLTPSVILCLKTGYIYTLKDNRTIAKEWIYKNLPHGAAVLVDLYPFSPPIKETKTQLERLYDRAALLNHYKKEYLKLLLEAHPDGNYGYEIYRVYRPPAEVSGIKYVVEEAEKMQDLVDVAPGFKYLRKKGIRYLVLNSWARHSGLNSRDKGIVDFYTGVEKNARILKQFPDKTDGGKRQTAPSKGPEIYVYEL